jgi:hypothetical protein
MHCLDDVERPFDRRMHIGQHGEGLFVIARDSGPVFGERAANAEEGGHVRVGDVMHELTYRPAIRSIGRVDLLVVERA